MGHISSCECKKVVSDIFGEINCVVDIESICKMTHFEIIVQVSTQSIYIFMEKTRYPKTMKYKGNLGTKWLFHKMTKNALTTLLHSTDEMCKRIFRLEL